MIKRILIFGLLAALLLHFRAGARVNKSGNTKHAEIDSLNEQAYRQIRSNLAKTLVILTDVEQLCIKNNYEKGLAVNYMYQADVFNQRGFSKRALILYTHALQLSRKNHDNYNIARAQEHLSSIQRRNGNLKEAERLLNSSLSIVEKLNKPVDLVNLQQRVGVIKDKQKDYAAALKIFENSCLVAKKINYLFGEKKSYFYRADLYAHMQNTDSAIYYYNKTLRIDTLTHDNYGKALSYIGLTKIYLKNKQLNKAISYADKAQLNADSIHAQQLLTESLELLIDASNQNNDLPGVTRWQQRLLKVERANGEASKNDAVLFVEVLKKQQEKQLAIQQEISGIQKISQTKSVIMLCILVVMLIAVLLIFSVSYNYRKTKAYAEELNKKNLQIEEHADSVAQLHEKLLDQNAILAEDNALKNKLLSIISHDLRHPLTNTKSIIDLVNLNLISAQEVGHLFGHLEAQYTRAVNLLDNLLYWIKSQVHDGHVEKVDINIRQMVGSLIEEQKLSLMKKEIRVANLINSDLSFNAEQELIKVIFRNLLTNAIKFTNHYGAIEFSSVTDIDDFTITVKDNGVGMNAETLSRINGLSHYTSKGTANEEGSGMGLMLIRDLIKKVDGGLKIDSKLGYGSTFAVSLALVAQPELHIEA